MNKNTEIKSETPLEILYKWVDTELKLLNYEHPTILEKIEELFKYEKDLLELQYQKGMFKGMQKLNEVYNY